MTRRNTAWRQDSRKPQKEKGGSRERSETQTLRTCKPSCHGTSNAIEQQRHLLWRDCSCRGGWHWNRMLTFELLDVNKPICTNRRTGLSDISNNFTYLMKPITLAVKFICSVLLLDPNIDIPGSLHYVFLSEASETFQVVGLPDSSGIRLMIDTTLCDHNPVTRPPPQTRLPHCCS